MICVKTSLKVSLWLALGYLNTKRNKIHAKIAKLYKKDVAFKNLGEKSCKIKGSGYEMAAMTLILIIAWCINHEPR